MLYRFLTMMCIQCVNLVGEMFIGLLLMAIKNDIELGRVAAFSERLLQVCDSVDFLFACGFWLNLVR